MSVIIRLQGLSWSSSAMDVRNFFQGLTIPPGGVHIIGGEKGDAFIAFSTDEDARQAMMRTAGVINENPVQLFLSSKTEMHNTITEAKQQSIVGVVTPNPAQAITKSTPTLTSGYPAPGIQITSVQQQQQPQANQFQNVYTNNMYNAASDSISWNTLVANEKTNNANEQDLPGEYSVGGMPSKQKHDQHAGYGSKEYTVERGITQTLHPTNKDPKSHTVPAMDACTPRYGQQVWDNLKPSGYQFQQQNWIENQHQEHIPHNINNMQAYNPHLFPPQEVTIPNEQNIKSFDQFGMPSLPVSTINAQTSLPHIASLANTPIDMPEIGPDIQPTILKSDPVIPINNDLFKENLHKIVPVTSSINRPLGSHKLPLLLNIPTTSSSPLEGQQLANATQNVEPQRGFGQFGPPDISHNLNKDGGSSDTKEKQATSIDISDDKERKDKDRERDKDRRDRRDRDRDEDRHRREHDRDRGDRDRGERDRDRDRSRRSRDRDRRRDNDRRNSPRESLSSGRSSRKRSLSPPSQSKADGDKTQQTKKSKDIAISSSFDNDSLQSQLTTHAMVSVTASSTMNLSESLYGKPLFPSADVNSFSDESKHGSSMGILGHAPPEFPIRGQIPSPVNNNNNSGSGQIHDQHQNTDWIVPPPDADDLHFKMHDDGKTRNFEEIHNAGTEGRPPGSGLERWVNDIGDRPGIDRGSEMHGSADRRGFDNGIPRGADRRRHEMERIHGMEHQLQDMGGPPRLDMQEHDMRGPLVFDRLSLKAGAPSIHGQKNEVAKPPGMNRQRLEMGGPSTMGMRMHDTGGPPGMDRRVNDIGGPVGIDRHGQELIGPPSMEKRGKEMVATPGMGRQGQDTGGPPGRDRRGPEIGGRPDIDRRGLETGGPPGKGRRGPEIGPPGIDMRWPEMRGPSGMDRRRPEMEGSPGTDRRGPEMGGPPGIDRQWPEIGGPLGMNRRVPEMGGPPGMDRPGPDMGGPPGMDRQGPKMGGPPVTDRRGPEMGGPPGIDRRGPSMGGPPGMDIRGPEMGGPSGMHRRGPDMGGPPGMDRRRPEMVPPAMDRRGPEMGGPPGMDRRGQDIGGPPGMDRRRPDMGPPSMDRRGPEMGGPPGMDRRGPDMGGPPGMDRRRPEMGPPAMDRRGSEIGGPPGMNRQGPEMRGPPGMDRRGSDMRGPPGMERREPEMGGPSDMDRRGPEMGGRPGMDRRGPEMGGPPGMDRRGPEMGGHPGMDRRGPEIGGPPGMHRRGPEMGGPPGMDRREPEIGEPLAMDRRGYDMGEPQSLRTPGVEIGGLSDIDRHGNPMKGPLLLGKRGNEMGGPSVIHGHEKEMGGPPHIKDRQGELTRNPMLGRQGNDTRRPPDIRDVETRGPPGIDRVERVRGNEMVEPPGLAKRAHVMELPHHRDGREDMIVPLGERNAPDIGRRGDDMGGPPGRMDRRENERFDMRGPPLLGRRPDEMGGPPDRDYWMTGDRGLDHRERQKGPPGPDRRVQEMGDPHILQRRDNEMQIGRRTDDVNEPPWSERRMDSGRGKADWIEEEHNSRRPSEERDELRRQEHESDKQGWRRRENIGSREHDNWPNRRGRWEENGRNFRERGNDSSDSNSRYDGDRGRGRQLPYGNRCRSPIREIHLNEKEISSYSHGRRSEHERSLDNRKDTRHCDDNRREKAERPTKGHDRSDKRDDMTNKNDHSVETRGRVEKNVQLLTGKANDNLTKNKGDSKDIGKLELNNDPDENEVKKDKNIAETNSKAIETNKLYAVHLRGLELTNNYRDIRRFLLSSEIPRDGIKIINDEKGNRTGQAYVKFTNSESFKKALSMDSKFCGINKVLVCSCSDKEFDAAVDSYIPEEVSDDENTPHGKAIDDANSASDGKSNIISTAKTGNDIEIKQMKPLSTSGFVISKPKEFIVKVSNLICNITHLKLKTLFIGCIIARNGDAIYIDVDRKKPGASANAHIEFKNAKSFGNALQVKKTMDRKDILVRPSTREELESVIEKNKTVNPKQYEQYMADMKKKNNCSKDSQKIEGEKAISTTAKSQNDGVKQDKPEDTKADTHLTCIQLSNLPLSYNSRDVRSLLDGFEIASRGIQVCHDAVGKPLGEGYVNFTNSVWANKAMKLTHGLILGRCKLSCKFISVEQMIENCRVSRKSLVPEAPSKQAVFFYVKASNLPKNVSIGEIMNYFDGCRPAPESMRLNIGDRSDGPDCSTALIGFWSREDAEMAISKTSGKLLQDKIANLTKVIV